MPSREDVHYFGAGPAPLPTSVLERASKALLNYEDKGIGLCEISHRSPEANRIIADTKSALTTFLNIPDSYDILFLQGGGSGEFSAVVFHMVAVWVEERRRRAERELDDPDKVLERIREELKQDLRLDYLITGSWSNKAAQEAVRLVGKQYVNVAVDPRETNDGKFGSIPPEQDWTLTSMKKGVAMTYFCDNETVDGVEFPNFPISLERKDDKADRLIVADMSSNFMSRRIDVSKYAVIFAGAQKNLGNAGITIVIIRKLLLTSVATPEMLRNLKLPISPIVFDWPTIAKNNSLYNTLPIFDVWIAGNVAADLIHKHGSKLIGEQEELSAKKSQLIYEILDKYPTVYSVVPRKAVRSRMNICFRLNGGGEKEKDFISCAEKIGLLGLKGHRSVGGIRASNYNAIEISSILKLVNYLRDYAEEQLN